MGEQGGFEFRRTVLHYRHLAVKSFIGVLKGRCQSSLSMNGGTEEKGPGANDAAASRGGGGSGGRGATVRCGRGRGEVEGGHIRDRQDVLQNVVITQHEEIRVAACGQ